MSRGYTQFIVLFQLIVIAILALIYGVPLAVTKAQDQIVALSKNEKTDEIASNLMDKMVTMSKDKRTDEIVTNVINSFINVIPKDF